MQVEKSELMKYLVLIRNCLKYRVNTENSKVLFQFFAVKPEFQKFCDSTYDFSLIHHFIMRLDICTNSMARMETEKWGIVKLQVGIRSYSKELKIFRYFAAKYIYEKFCNTPHLSLDYLRLEYPPFLPNQRACPFLEVNDCQSRFFVNFCRMIRLDIKMKEG